MTSLARWCFQHKFRVLAAWLAALFVLGGLAQSAGDGYTDSFTLSGTESTTAYERLGESFDTASNDTNQVVFAGDIAAEKDRIDTILRDIGEVKDIASVGELQVSEDGRVAFAPVVMDGEQPIADVPAEAYQDLEETALDGAGDGLRVEVGGDGFRQAAQNEEQGGASEMIGFGAAAVVLLLAFGSLFAMLLPLATAVISLGTALMATALLAHIIDIATFSPQLATLIGLGVGIDYALFVVTRHRNAIKAGRTPEEACMRSLNTSGRAVLFAGATVIVALLGLFVLGVSFLNGVAIAASITVLVTMLAAVTLMPAFLGMMGMKVLSRKERRRLEQDGPHDPKLDGRWPKWAAFVQRRPLPLAAVALVVMLGLAIPTFDLRLGSSDAGQDPPSSTARQAYDLLAEGFGPGFNGRLQIVVELPGPAEEISKAIGETEGIAAAAPPVTSPDGRIALIDATPATAPQDEATSELIDRLRDDVVPGVAGDANVYVGGITAIFDDFAVVLSEKLPLFIFVIVFLGCVLLMIAFRSIVIPLTAAVMNLLAAGAAFGVVTAIFQKGFLAEPLGVGEGPIEAFLPVMMLAILFGLSMDYQVFLVSRMHEEWMRTKDNATAVRVGQAATGRVITAAATIMICVFGSFLLAGERVIAEFGIGLASAVLLDAFILRTILVPAVMHLIGERNWWLPKPLDRVLPKVAVEGHVRTVRSRAEALAVLRDPGRYTVDDPRFATARIVGRSVLSTDGEEHARRRAPFEGRFAVDEAWMRAEADALVAAFGDEVELRAEYAGPFAARVMQHVLGLDAVPIEDLLRGYLTIAAATVGDIPEEDGRKAFAGLPLDSDTAVALFGGIDTMEGMILNLVLHVLTGQATTVDGSLALDPAVGEVHRYDGDELVVIKLKDAALPFAAGSHACPAAQLARQEARVALEALPALELIGAPVIEGEVFRKPRALTVRKIG